MVLKIYCTETFLYWNNSVRKLCGSESFWNWHFLVVTIFGIEIFGTKLFDTETCWYLNFLLLKLEYCCFQSGQVLYAATWSNLLSINRWLDLTKCYFWSLGPPGPKTTDVTWPFKYNVMLFSWSSRLNISINEAFAIFSV